MINNDPNINNDRIKWTKEKIIEEIRNLNNSNIPLNAVYMTKHNIKLYGAARVHFGSWGNALEAAGLDYTQINHKFTEKSWSKDVIAEEIINFASTNGNLRSDYVQKHYTKLHSAAQRYFDSWKDAVEYAGFDYNNIKKIKWSKEKIIMTILEMNDNNIPLSSSSVQKMDTSLFQAACRIFGSWANAVNTSGLDYSKIKKQKEWEESSIKEELLRIKELRGNLSVTNVIKENSSVYQAAKRHFPNKSWSEIVKKIEE